MTINKKLWILILTGLIVTGIFFRAQLSSLGFVGFGDSLDGLIAFSIVHHWYNFFHGVENWQTVGYFYPYVNTLGYNDGYFLYGVFYTLFRAFDLNMFLSLELSSACIRLIGFYAFFYLAHQQLRLKFWACLLTAAIFSLSTAAAAQANHIQLLTVSFAPLLTIFLIHYYNALFIKQNATLAIVWGSFAGVFYASWLLSTYYMAWFYTFFATMFLALLLIFQYRYRFLILKKPPIVGILIPFVITLLALTPFLLTYLPIAFQSGMHSYSDTRTYSPTLINLIDIERHNIIWKSLIRRFDFTFGENTVGFPPIFLIIFTITAIQVLRAKQDNNLIYVRLLVCTVLASLLITLSFNGYSLWWFVWKFFPGAKGLRVVDRDWIFLVFPMSLVLCYFFSHQVIKSTVGKAIIMLISLLLIAEQYSIKTNTHLDRAKEQAFVDASTPIPSACRVFYVTGSRYKYMPRTQTAYLNNVDAMLISEITGVRTINGFSTFNPPDWDFAYYPQETYHVRIDAYLKKHQIREGVCWFDIDKMRWMSAAFS